MDESTPKTIPYFLRERIGALIVDGTYRPGQPLREQDLERRFGTSRGPIREALRLLELAGLVTHTQRRGFRVTLYDDKEIRDQYLLRAELEAYAINQLADAGDLAPLIAELTACRKRLAAARTAKDPRAYLSEIRHFYDAIALGTGNRPLCEVLARLNEVAEPLRYNLLSRRLDESRSPQYMKRIVDALAAGRFQEAADLKRAHVLENMPSIIDAYAAARYQEGRAQRDAAA
ncbi:GntR family transcriptional regulator [Bordetella genomosp. 13]|uniref:GntR family transcriptional regulator n=1 Tax=Bordetella genomosp. 13 TaxID=463040 RepID=UPI0011A37FE6|nr:GntR family transcriptional regulator [Bordetella genomosp. 13]